MTSSCIAVILAGGVGQRFGQRYPKQFAKVAGKTLIEHTMECFQNHERIDEIIVVSKAEYNRDVMTLVTKNAFTKVSRVINGGEQRADSTKAALAALARCDPQTKILIHDAVRPFVTPSIISRCIDALDTYNAVDVIIDSADTIVQIDEQGHIEDIPDRKWMKRGQTPQAFRLGVLQKAYAIADERGGVHATCDCGIVLKTLPEETVATVAGHASNIKVTDPLDLYIADKLFQMRGDTSPAAQPDYRQALADKVIVIFGGSYGIGESIGRLASQNGARVFSFSRSTTGTDVVDKSAVARALDSVFQETGRIDMVVNTAAILIRKALNLTPEEEVDKIIDINFKGTVNVAVCAHPYLKQTAGSLLLFTSSSYTRGREYYSLYSATKCAVVNFMQAIAEEWMDDGIRVNCINPERTATPMRTSNFGSEPPHTLLQPDTVARASLNALLSSSTGHVIDVRLAEHAE